MLKVRSYVVDFVRNFNFDDYAGVLIFITAFGTMCYLAHLAGVF